MSGTARILDRLRRGPATAAELYGLHCIVHSRIAELRKQGHVIVCTRTPGLSGPGAYSYRIVDGSLTDGGRKEERDNGRRSVAPMPPSVSDPLTDRGRGATAATAHSSHDPMLGDGEDEFATGTPQSSGPESQLDVGADPAAMTTRLGRPGVPSPSGSEQLCLDVAA